MKKPDNYVMDPGAMALNSPVCDIIKDAIKTYQLGFNGFQILTKLKLSLDIVKE